MSIIGYDTKGSFVEPTWKLAMSKFQASESNNADSITVYIYDQPGSGGNIQVGIYADNAGSPGTCLVHSSSEAISAGYNNWKTVSIDSTALTSGQYYWLACQTDTYGMYLYVDSGDTNQKKESTSWTFGDWSDNPSPLVSANYKISIYSEFVTPPASVVTNSATNVAKTTARLNGTISDIPSGDTYEVWFEYWEDESGASHTETAKVEKTVDGSFYADVSGLNSGITYKFKAKAQSTESGSEEIEGSELEFTTTTLTVVTDAVSDLKATSITLNGTLSNLESGESADVWFEYWKENESGESGSITETSKVEVSEDGSFNANISGLDPNTAYKYKAKAQLTESGENEVEGNVVSFTTNDVIGITTNSATVITSQSARLNGTIDSLGDEDEVEVWFEYWEESESGESGSVISTSKQTKSVTGTFYADITSLSQETTYKFRAIIQGKSSGAEEVDDSTLSFTTNTPAEYANRIIYSNPLYIVCNTSPVKIIEIDISGATPSWTVTELDASGEDLNNAKDICLNDTFDKLYVACGDGKVVKLNKNDFSDRETIEVESGSGADNMKVIDCVDNQYKTFIGSDNSSAELYEIDESEIATINTDFRTRKLYKKIVETMFSYIKGIKIATKFAFLKLSKTLISTDFRYRRYDYDDITPTPRENFTVEIDGTEVEDIDLSSIVIRWVLDDTQSASFKLARKHDNLDYDTVAEDTSEITNNNTVTITVTYQNKTLTLFSGKVENIDASGSNEWVIVECIGAEKDKVFQTVDLALPTLNEQQHLYHVIDCDINIKKPIIEYDDDDNPTFYKGIKVDLGKSIQEQICRYYVFSGGLTEEEFEEFLPKQNWTYFWFMDVEGFIGDNKGKSFNQYVGTSLSSLSNDLWSIDSISYWRQRIFENVETELGYYYLGSAPYREISVKNGRYNAQYKWIDKEDGLYLEKGESYDYVNYAKKVADVEWLKLSDVNDVFYNDSDYKETTAIVNIALDGLLYYGIGVSTKINISNTTESDIYKDNNGFPLRIREIEINVGTMTVHLTADNIRTQDEIEELYNDYYPDEPDVISEVSTRIFPKFDPTRYEDVS